MIEDRKKKDKEEQEKIKKEVINLVIARLRTIPPKASLSVGGQKDLSVEDLIKHVRENDEIGQLVIETHLDYIRSLKDLPITTEEDEYSNN